MNKKYVKPSILLLTLEVQDVLSVSNVNTDPYDFDKVWKGELYGE